MDRISHLPEEILSKILSFLETKDVTGTMLLSKRWKSLWKIIPRLKFDDSESSEPEYWKFQKFVDRSLMSRQGQVLQSLNSNELVEANVMVILHRPDKLLQSLASVERLRLCLHASEFVSPVDSCFRRLKHLEMCTCFTRWLDIFMHLLKNSPNLKVIKFNKFHDGDYPQPQWNQPGSVPRCFFSNLETFVWKNYQGTQVQKELSTFILKNAVCLKKASFITAKSIDDHKKKLEMLQELALPPRISTTCELLFN